MCEVNKKKLKQKCNELALLVKMQSDFLEGPNDSEDYMRCTQSLMKSLVFDMHELITK